MRPSGGFFGGSESSKVLADEDSQAVARWHAPMAQDSGRSNALTRIEQERLRPEQSRHFPRDLLSTIHIILIMEYFGTSWNVAEEDFGLL
jgi:hypothetical protein